MTTQPLLAAEVKQFAHELPHYLKAWHLAERACTLHPMGQHGKHRAAAYREVVRIGDRLASQLVCNVKTLSELLAKHAAHGYRPTLRGAPGTPESLLADAYDWLALASGLTVRAYRGTQP